MRRIHRWILRRYGITPGSVLNQGGEPHASAEPVAAELLRLARAMEAEAFDPGNRQVDYAGLHRSLVYEECRRCALRLQSFDPGTLTSREDRLAFWINLYNALVVDAVIQFGVRRTVNEVPGFFWRAAYLIGGRRYCAHDIEHGILRANSQHPAIPGAHFGQGDVRRRYSLDGLDPRIHFALVCAARSCPPIAAYDPAQIDSQLDLAAQAFINGGGVEIDSGAGAVRLSQIFRWYAQDFGGRWLAVGSKRPLLRFVFGYLEREADRQFVTSLGPVSVSFMPYDWSLNLRA